MSTINLEFNHIADNQNNKEPVFNDVIDRFDALITEDDSFTVNSSNILTITEDQFKNNNIFVIEPDGGAAPTAQITITIPNIKRSLFAVRNNTLEEVKIRVLGQLLVDRIVEAGETAHYNSDGAVALTPQGAVSVDALDGTAGWSKTRFINIPEAEFDSAFDDSFAIGEDKEEITFLLPANSGAVQIVGWIKPFQDNDDLHLNFSIDGGVSYKETPGDYQTAIRPVLASGSDGSDSGSTLDSKILLAIGVGNDTDEKCSFDITIRNHRDSSEFTEAISRSVWQDNSGILNRGRGGGVHSVANIVNFARLKFNNGNIAEARFMIIALPDTV